MSVKEFVTAYGDSAFQRREEVVRCRDCKFFATNIHGSYCKKSITWLSSPDGYCAWGCRKQ